MTGFICKKCGYRIESEFSKAGKKCPYCGESKMDEEPSAGDLLDME